MDLKERSDLVLSFAKVLHDNGESTDETIEAAKRLGNDVGLSARLVPGWGNLQLQSREGDAELITATAVSPMGVEMGRVNSAMQAIGSVGAHQLDPAAARDVITSISRIPPVPTWQFVLAAAGGAAALSLIFGVQHPLSVLLIMASAAAGAALRRAIAMHTDNPFVQPFCAAAIAGVIGAIAVIYNLSSTLRLIAVCPCLVLVPGPHVLNGMIDLLQARISLAVSRLVYAGFILLSISAGLLVTLALFDVTLPVDALGRSISLLIDVAAAGVAAAAYAVFYSTPPRMIVWPVVVGMIAHALRFETLAASGNVVIASFIGALFVGLVLTPIARLRRMPFAAIGFASVVSMIPGVYVLRTASGMTQLINTPSPTTQLLVATSSDAVTTVVITLALAFGLVVPKLVIGHYLSERLEAPGSRQAIG